MRLIGFWATLAAALGAMACSEHVDSTDVRTSGVYADMSVHASGNGKSDVQVDLLVGGSNSNTHLVLKGADKLTATVGTVSRVLSKSGNVYATTFDGEAAETQFVVSFTRGPDDTSAPNSSVTLPEGFIIGGIAQTVSRQVGFTATWQAGTKGEPVTWVLRGDCLVAQAGSISDAGQTVIPASRFVAAASQEQATCNASFCLERDRQGTIDPAFGEGGVFGATQNRCAAFLSAP
jgi:hypothetical protein